MESGQPFEVNLAKTSAQVPLPPMMRKAFDETKARDIREMYQLIYSNDKICHVSRFFYSFYSLLYAGNYYRSSLKDVICSSIVTAKWFDDSKRPAIIREFMKHDIIVKDENNETKTVTYILAYVEWYACYTGPNNRYYAYPLEVWADRFMNNSKLSFLPVGRIKQKCVAVKGKVKNRLNRKESINVIIPLQSETRM